MIKPKHIMIEGPDGCGKSSICKMLSKKLDIPVIKMQHAKRGFRKGFIEDLSVVFNKTLVQFKKYDFIVDRGYLSSCVYSIAFNRNTDFSYINKIHDELNTLVIILTATNKKLFERRPNDSVITQQNRIKINKIYKTYSILEDHYLIDTTNLTKKQVVDKILKIIEKHYGSKY